MLNGMHVLQGIITLDLFCCKKTMQFFLYRIELQNCLDEYSVNEANNVTNVKWVISAYIKEYCGMKLCCIQKGAN
jgi:hypothetical protein